MTKAKMTTRKLMTYTKRKLRSILRRVLNESSGLGKRMEDDIVDQYESSLKDLDGGFEIEIPNEPATIEGAKEFLQLRFGVDPEEYMEEEDGDMYIIYSYGEPGDDFDQELV